MSKVSLIFVGVLALVCLMLWTKFGWLAAMAAWGVGVTMYLGLHLLRQRQLLGWLQQPEKSLPSTSGHWAEIFNYASLYKQKYQTQDSLLEASLARFKNAVGVLPDGVVLFNEQMQVEWCNHAAEQQLGLDLSRDMDTNMNAELHHPQAVAYLQQTDLTPIKISAVNQPESVYELKIYTFGAQQKIMLCQDINQTEKLDAMRRDFIANVSHELRTPLTVVSGFLETLEDSPDAVMPTFKSYISLMAQQAQRMRNLVDDLLTVSRIESNQDAPELREINMQQLIARIVDNAQGLSKGKHVITTHVASQLNLSGAEEEVFSALSNLVNNAIRYTPEGGTIQITWVQYNGEAVYSVQDSGIGIAPEHIGRITERFYRVDKSRSRDTGGTGLGLSIVKRILARHQARLEINSELGKGSTFSAIFAHERVINANT